MQGLEEHRGRAFSLWLRTGRRLPDPDGRQIERKFNPWHDPRDGRFTFAGAGRYAGLGGGGSARPVSRRAQPTDYVEDFTKPPLGSLREADAWRARELAKHRGEPGQAAVIEARYHRYRQAFAPQPAAPPSRVASRVASFADGVGDGLYDTGKGAVAGVYALATTNPLTTARNIGRNIAGAIDSAISAEDTPATVQIDRAANAIANASALPRAEREGRFKARPPPKEQGQRWFGSTRATASKTQGKTITTLQQARVPTCRPGAGKRRRFSGKCPTAQRDS